MFNYSGNPLFNDPRDSLHRPLAGIPPLNAARMEQTHAKTGPDGSFDLIVLPGRGVLLATLLDRELNLAELAELKKDPDLLRDTVPHLNSRSFSGLKLIEVPENEKEMQVDFGIEVQPKNENVLKGFGTESQLPDGQKDVQSR